MDINGFPLEKIYLDEMYDLHDRKGYIAIINDGGIIIVKEW